MTAPHASRESPATPASVRLLALVASPQILMDLKALCASSLPGAEILEAPGVVSPDRIPALLDDLRPAICVLDAIADPLLAEALLGVVASVHADLPVVTLHDGRDADAILRALRQGASEVLVLPLTQNQFATVMTRVCQRIVPDTRRRHRVISVHPVKGACGATTLACNLAWSMKKSGAGRVLLADLDPLSGTVGFTFKARSAYSFVEALAHTGSLDEDLFRGMVSTVHGVDVLLSPERPVHGLDEDHDIAPVIAFARGLYDVIVLDTNGPYGAWNLSAARQSDDVLLVATNELQAMQAAKRALAYMDRQRIARSKIRLIVNRFEKSSGLGRDIIGAALHHNVTAFLPEDRAAVQRAVVAGRPINGNGPLPRGLQTLSAQMLGQEEKRPKPKPKQSPWDTVRALLKRAKLR